MNGRDSSRSPSPATRDSPNHRDVEDEESILSEVPGIVTCNTTQTSHENKEEPRRPQVKIVIPSTSSRTFPPPPAIQELECESSFRTAEKSSKEENEEEEVNYDSEDDRDVLFSDENTGNPTVNNDELLFCISDEEN